MPDRIVPETAGIPRVRTVAGQRWREQAQAADNQERKRRNARDTRRPVKRSDEGQGGEVDEFA